MNNKVNYQHNDEYGNAFENEVKCDNCHKRVIESKALFFLGHQFCSKKCLNEYVDLM